MHVATALVVSRLPPNEEVLSGRLVRKGVREHLNTCTAHFRLPLPPSARDPAWQKHLRAAFKQLTFEHKLGALSAAAESGCETNLELAWDLVRPCMFTELLQPPQAYRVGFYDLKLKGSDPGVAAVRAGHAATVLPWLVDHNCPLDPDRTLETAAECCDLAGLQAAWEVLGFANRKLEPPAMFSWHMYFTLSEAAGRSGGESAIAKLTWLWSVAPAAVLHSFRSKLLVAAAKGAAAAGSLPLLQWLRGQGLDLARSNDDEPNAHMRLEKPWAAVLGATLAGGHVAAADWLVGEGGCPLPGEAVQNAVESVWLAAAEGGHVESLRWLLGRGVPLYEQSALHAARSGQLEALRFLHQECGAELTAALFVAAAGSRSVPTAAWLLQAGCPMGPEAPHQDAAADDNDLVAVLLRAQGPRMDSTEAYVRAATAGDADMVTWLVREARCSWGPHTMDLVRRWWPRTPAAVRRGLQQAMGVLEKAGCPALQAGSYEAAQALNTAATRGDMWLLRRLHGGLGAALGRGTAALAAEGGCEAVLEWLVGAGCELGGGGDEGEIRRCDPYIRAGCSGNLGVMECLVQLKVGFNPQMLRLAAQDSVPLPVLRWLVERGAPWDEAAAAAVANAVRDGKRRGLWGDSVRWLEGRLGQGGAGGQ